MKYQKSFGNEKYLLYVILFLTGCPLIRDKNSHKLKGCVPTIALPTCMDKCDQTATVQVSDVPMKCPRGIEMFQDVKIPTQCRCTC